MSEASIHPDDRLLTINEYCTKFKRSRASFYRDQAADRICVIMIGRSPRIVERLTLERLASVGTTDAA